MKNYPALDLRFSDVDLLYAALDDFSPTAIEERDDGIRAFFLTTSDRDAAHRGLAPQFRTSPVEVPDDDWARRSQEGLPPIIVGQITVVDTNPQSPIPNHHALVIRPSMGFGTGHHATTRLCLEALQKISLDRRTVLDVGTGSAVLAIAASRLGAEEVTGIDDDPDAIQAAWDNLSLNPSALVTLIVGDLRQTELVPADVILANLTGGLLVQSADRLRSLTNWDGRLILSGFTVAEEQDVLAAFGAFTVEHRGEEEGWVCVTLK